MNGIEFRDLQEMVVDDDYQGLLSSYIEPDARRKIMFDEDHDTNEMNKELSINKEASIFLNIHE
ncbi:MAG: hypothetical protein PVH79_01665 [Candidatus Bathyarchaeota archaeon]|jgi:hypothetical protein